MLPFYLFSRLPFTRLMISSKEFWICACVSLMVFSMYWSNITPIMPLSISITDWQRFQAPDIRNKLTISNLHYSTFSKQNTTFHVSTFSSEHRQADTWLCCMDMHLTPIIMWRESAIQSVLLISQILPIQIIRSISMHWQVWSDRIRMHKNRNCTWK